MSAKLTRDAGCYANIGILNTRVVRRLVKLGLKCFDIYPVFAVTR